MSNGGDRVTRGKDWKQRREALHITPGRFARMARVAVRSLNYAENEGKFGDEVARKIDDTLARLEAGEVIDENAHVMRVQLRPGVYITVDADNEATLGDLRDVEARIQRLIDSYRE